MSDCLVSAAGGVVSGGCTVVVSGGCTVVVSGGCTVVVGAADVIWG